MIFFYVAVVYLVALGFASWLIVEAALLSRRAWSWGRSWWRWRRPFISSALGATSLKIRFESEKDKRPRSGTGATFGQLHFTQSIVHGGNHDPQ